ncbi:hypothetical protein G9A89_010600 [Geosiphon pyriformis]|nr:hypothetical protein G9A89_010600 [Geosiphon pyriformis]
MSYGNLQVEGNFVLDFNGEFNFITRTFDILKNGQPSLDRKVWSDQEIILSSRGSSNTDHKLPVSIANNSFLVNILTKAAKETSSFYSNEGTGKEIVPGVFGLKLSFQEWMTRKYSLVKAHEFNAKIDKIFLNQWRLMSQKLGDELLTIIEPSVIKGKNLFDLTIMGHGVGAVYAVFTSFILGTLFPSNIKIITFGEPRIGSFEFAKKMNSLSKINNLNIYRVILDDDYVPRLPNSGGRSLFHHINEIWIPPECECINESGDRLIYQCYGKVVNVKKGIIEESQLCNNRYKNFEDKAHYGPYFGYMIDYDRPTQ